MKILEVHNEHIKKIHKPNWKHIHICDKCKSKVQIEIDDVKLTNRILKCKEPCPNCGNVFNISDVNISQMVEKYLLATNNS